MFLKTEQFEYNGVSVTLSELSALQRIEHLALLKRRAEEAEASGNLQVSVEDLVRGEYQHLRCHGGVPGR